MLRGFSEGREGHIVGAATILGLRAALHGFGLLSLMGAALCALAAIGTWRERVMRVFTFGTWATTAYVGWVVWYLIGLTLPVEPGHASAIHLRPLAVSHVAENGIVLPILSAQGILDIGATMLMVGVPVLLLGLWKSESGRERRLIWLFALPSLIFLVAWWPAQGVSMESDLLFAIFPAFFAGAWSCSRTPAATVAGLSLVLVCHVVFWWVILAPDFETVFVSIASRGLLLLT